MHLNWNSIVHVTIITISNPDFDVNIFSIVRIIDKNFPLRKLSGTARKRNSFHSINFQFQSAFTSTTWACKTIKKMEKISLQNCSSFRVQSEICCTNAAKWLIFIVRQLNLRHFAANNFIYRLFIAGFALDTIQPNFFVSIYWTSWRI